ncbi:phosphoenolpyruvate carboxykinase [ATP] [Labrys miyagiensis]|uniref:Phosphoenolpyruvate carboxykinase (ATP) n=1 Tax=Labrys miyagiensis TaxID=346912 RepID=A0ABQ6CNZ2_9HYPH|nr:phosphoenolpyruvate carboxykinase [Labrys miyagiensis]GLS21860.1 phosphoenolpyruvate carboxykinase [ATP] [Labrys miyagiensis]
MTFKIIEGGNPATPEPIQFNNLAAVFANLDEAALVEKIIRRNEGLLSPNGAVVVDTGSHTGRSPKDKFVVREDATEEKVWWDNNNAITRQAFDKLLDDMLWHATGKELYVQDLRGGADPAHGINVRVYTEYAWHSLFIRNLLIRPPAADLVGFWPDLTIIDLPSFKADPAKYGIRSETVIACDLTNGIILIGGTAYAGEMKKSVFTYLNYTLPEAGVMPMHCSANIGADGDVAVFFGLSGTGKTTLSASSDRALIGDDEHGWGPDGVFNFEGGCYAKTIKLDPAAEPQIYAATQRFGTILENVAMHPVTRRIDFDGAAWTENTRAAYPLHFIENASPTGRGGQPKTIVMLTADAFGVMPPIAKLSPDQAIYHFLSGFTAKVAGTERGVTEPQPTFSTCFGAPFIPRHPAEYAKLLRELILEHEVTCWLVNTGWTGGAYGTGRRMPIQWTRTLLSAALDGTLAGGGFRTDRHFGFKVPTAVTGVPTHVLDPFKTWADKAAYEAQAKRLVGLFAENFRKFEPHVDKDVKAVMLTS